MAAATHSPSIYQFKIAQKYIKPQVWRRIQVPESYTFFDLHVAIQDVFKWSGYHLHNFEMVKPNRRLFQDFLSGNYELSEYIGIPHRELADEVNILPERETRIADQFSLTNKNKCLYVYDFCSELRHDITLEKILVAQPDVKYPICIDGRGQTPVPRFSKNDINFRNPEVVWHMESFQGF